MSVMSVRRRKEIFGSVMVEKVVRDYATTGTCSGCLKVLKNKAKFHLEKMRRTGL